MRQTRFLGRFARHALPIACALVAMNAAHARGSLVQPGTQKAAILLSNIETDPALLENRARLLTEQAQAAEYGESVPQDYHLAAKLYCEAARLGYAEAQYDLGWMYANGRGLEHDDLIANSLFARAAQQGHLQAQRMKDRLGDTPEKLPACMTAPLQPAVAVAAEDKNAGQDVERLVATSPERKHIVDLVKVLAPRYSVDPHLVLALISVESDFNPGATSTRNAQGLMQLIPETAERFGVRNTFDTLQNLRGGIAYLRWLLAYFQGDVALALAGYNAGEGAVNKYHGVPPFPETQMYVRKILELFHRQAHPYDPSVTQPSPALPLMRGWRRAT